MVSQGPGVMQGSVSSLFHMGGCSAGEGCTGSRRSTPCSLLRDQAINYGGSRDKMDHSALCIFSKEKGRKESWTLDVFIPPFHHLALR